MIKLFASDLDGTLLARAHQFDEIIKTTIEKVIDSGSYFTVATGRDPSMSKFDGLENRIYRICMNGAIIIAPNGSILKKSLIDKEVLKILIDSFFDLELEFISPNRVYTNISKEQFINSWKSLPPKNGEDLNVAKLFMQDALNKTDFSLSTEEILSKDICKINTHVKPNKSYGKLYEFLDKHKDKLLNAPCDKGIIEITDSQTNKGNAVKWLANYLNIKDDEVAVYGDGGNDVHMLRMFEHSYSPNNALNKAKEAASYVIDNSNEYSVALHILNTLIRQKQI